MAYNYLGLVNEVNRRLNEVELTSSNFSTATGFYSSIKDAVNASIRHINHEEFGWPWNHVEEEDLLTAGTVRYGYPTEAKTIDVNSFRIKKDINLNVSTTKLTNLNYRDYLKSWVDHEYNTDTSIRGTPRYIVKAPNQEYIVVPSPDKEYELVYEYYRNTLDLSLYDDVPSSPSEFRHVIVDGAMYYCYQFRGDNQAASITEAKFKEGIKHMRTLFINSYDYISSTVIQRSSLLGGSAGF